MENPFLEWRRLRMYDGGKIITGLIIGIGLIAFPIWLNAGKAVKKADPKLPAKEKQCVEPTQYMLTNHMELLDLWRDSVVRLGDRYFISFDGKKYRVSLQNTCMSAECHPKKKEFCDECHDYMGIEPYCWDCHIEKGEKK